MPKDYIREFTTKDIISLRNPNVVAIGGGTGLSSLLRGLKEYTDNITAVVTVGDDGGSSGRLRDDLDLLPPGDIRNCILALAEDENLMTQLFDYRFKEGDLKGHSFGNLFLAAMNEISYDFYQAIRRTSDVLHIKGRVLPVTLNRMTLIAELEDGFIIEGESRIPEIVKERNSSIKSLYLKNKDIVKPLDDAISSIKAADIIILGPGSLYTSVISNLLVPGIVDALKKSNALIVWVSNLMTQPGETDNLDQLGHLEILNKYLDSDKIIDVIIQNGGKLPEIIENIYKESNQEIVNPIISNSPRIITEDLFSIENKRVRHKTERVAELLFDYYLQNYRKS